MPPYVGDHERTLRDHCRGFRLRPFQSCFDQRAGDALAFEFPGHFGVRENNGRAGTPVFEERCLTFQIDLESPVFPIVRHFHMGVLTIMIGRAGIYCC